MRERQGRFVEYRLADKRAARPLDQAEELVDDVGRLVEACPRYGTPAAARGARFRTTRRARTRR